MKISTVENKRYDADLSDEEGTRWLALGVVDTGPIVFLEVVTFNHTIKTDIVLTVTNLKSLGNLKINRVLLNKYEECLDRQIKLNVFPTDCKSLLGIKVRYEDNKNYIADGIVRRIPNFFSGISHNAVHLISILFLFLSDLVLIQFIV